jgi:hypothetical protein
MKPRIFRSLMHGAHLGTGTVLGGAVLCMLAVPARAQSDASKLVLNLTNLAPLDESGEGHYEGWAIVAGSPVSTGKFNINEMGEPIGLGGGPVIDEFDAGQDITTATDIKISIEPPGDMDAIPSGLIIVDGVVSMKKAQLAVSVPHAPALESSTGAFVLATPSDDFENTENPEQGIWFLTMPGPTPGFMALPDIGPDWVYEGWVVDTSGGGPMPYSTGTFSFASQMDSDAAGCNGGGPPFPGEDFVPFHCGPELTLNSGDFLAVLTIEPVPDTSPGPFQLKPMAGSIPPDAVGMPGIALGNQVAGTFPTGTAVLFGGQVPAATQSWGGLKSKF